MLNADKHYYSMIFKYRHPWRKSRQNVRTQESDRGIEHSPTPPGRRQQSGEKPPKSCLIKEELQIARSETYSMSPKRSFPTGTTTKKTSPLDLQKEGQLSKSRTKRKKMTHWPCTSPPKRRSMTSPPTSNQSPSTSPLPQGRDCMRRNPNFP